MSAKSDLPRHVSGEWASTSRLGGVHGPGNTRSYSLATTLGSVMPLVALVPANTHDDVSTMRRSAETGEHAYCTPTICASGRFSGARRHWMVAAFGSVLATGSLIVR